MIAPFDPSATSPNSLLGPSARHWLGTDSIGRDVLSRLIVGGRTTLLITAAAVSIALAAGLVLGLLSGYVGGLVDEIIMRLLDVVFAFPVFLLAIAVVAALGPTVPNLILTIAIVYTPAMARVVRGPGAARQAVGPCRGGAQRRRQRVPAGAAPRAADGDLADRRRRPA